MDKTFFSFLCGFLICAATLTVQAKVQDANSRYYQELLVDVKNGQYGILFRSKLIVPYEYDTIIAQQDNRGYITQQGDKYGIRTVFIHYGENTAEMQQSSRLKQYFFEEKEGIRIKAKGINLHVRDIPCEYDKITFSDGKYWVSKGDLKGVLSSAGGTIIRCEFDKIEWTSDGKYVAYKNGNKSVYSSAGGLLHTDSDVIYSTN